MNYIIITVPLRCTLEVAHGTTFGKREKGCAQQVTFMLRNWYHLHRYRRRPISNLRDNHFLFSRFSFLHFWMAVRPSRYFGRKWIYWMWAMCIINGSRNENKTKWTKRCVCVCADTSMHRTAGEDKENHSTIIEHWKDRCYFPSKVYGALKSYIHSIWNASGFENLVKLER